MFAGYLYKRNVPISPPSMQRVYSVLSGTLLLDYESEEDARLNISPKLASEILGISEWDGVGRAHQYTHGFIIVTHTGETWYLNASSAQERKDWILHVKRALECNFANPDIVPFKPSKILQSLPNPRGNLFCPCTHQPLSNVATYTCRGCGRGYSSAEYVHEYSTILQLGLEHAERVCLDCKISQICVYWLKIMNYAHVMILHEFTPSVSTDINRFKCSFKIRRKMSQRLDMAATLFEKNSITSDEFEELRRVDYEYRREQNFQESRSLKEALDAIGTDMQMIISLLLSPSTSDRGGRSSYAQIVNKILEIADEHPELIDFYWPQLIQVHLLLNADFRTFNGAYANNNGSSIFVNSNLHPLIKIDLIQQMLLAISLKYPPLALKLAWALTSVSSDYPEKRVSQCQYAACMCLLLQLEMLTTGFISAIADVPSCQTLHRILTASDSQQQEIGCEIGILFLSRRRLQEVYDLEEMERRGRNIKKGNLYAGNKQNNFDGSNVFGKNDSGILESPDRQIGGDYLDTGTNDSITDVPIDESSCNYIFNHMGVGRSNSQVSDSHISSTKDRCYNKRHASDLFGEQLDFMKVLTDLAESLRFIDRPLRTDTLKRNLEKLNERPMKLGWDPTVCAGEPCYRIKRIIVEECRVFRTKARAPSLIVCEVVRDDIHSNVSHSVSDSKLERDRERKSDLNQSMALDAHQVNSGSAVPKLFDTGTSTSSASHLYSDGIAAAVSLVSAPPSPSRGTYTTLGLGPSAVHTRGSRGISVNVENIMDMDEVDGLVKSGISQAIADIKDNASSNNQQPGIKQPSPMKSELSSSGSSGNLYSLPGTQQHRGSISSSALPQSNSSGVKRTSLLSGNRKSMSFFNTLETYTSDDKKAQSNYSSSALVSDDVSSTDEASLDRNPLADPVEIMSDLSDIVEVPLFRDSKSDTQRGYDSSDTKFVDPGCSSLSLQSSGTTPLPPLPHVPATAFVKKKVLQSAQSLLNAGKIAESEFNMLILSDSRFRDLTARDEAIFTMIRVENAFGESWESKKERILGDRLYASSWRDLDYDHRSSDTIGLNIDEDQGNGNHSDNQLANKSIERKQHDRSGVLSSGNAQNSSNHTRSPAETISSIHADTHADQGGLNLGGLQISEIGSIARNNSHQSLNPLTDKLNIPGKERDSNASIVSTELQRPQWPLYDLRTFIVKSNDDLRQEVCCLQVMSLCKEIFSNLGLDRYLWLNPYRIVSTGSSSGIVQVLPDTMSLDALKKTPGFTNLPNYFKATYGSSSESLLQAKKNFASSLAAYSLFCHILSIKDRHNGNILIDADGHIAHIDFGFILSIAPGGAFSLESAPFKLTEEMVEVLEGIESSLFGFFVKSFTLGFLALRSHAEIIVSDIQLLSTQSPFPCFNGKDVPVIIEKLRNRFRCDLPVKDFVKHCMDLIVASYGAYGTKQYDSFQWYTNGIST